MSVESIGGLTPTDFAVRALRDAAWGGTQTVANVVANVRKATWSRTAFAAVMAVLSTSALPVSFALIYFAGIAAWELAIRLLLENKLALPAGARSQSAGFRWLAAINLIGATAYTFYPVLAWSTGEAIGMVLATAWICGSANHLFVYFSANRLLLAVCVAPLVVCALVAPFTTEGFTLLAMVAAAALVSLIAAAGLFGLDRQVLLGNLAKHAAARMSAEQANAAKSQFLATMSHELRTPLNSVIGYAELIQEEAEGGPIADDAGKIRAAARQLLGVIDVILDLSRLETGTIQLQPDRIHVSAVLEQLRETALPLAAANNNTVTIAESDPLGEAYVDHMRLYQCLMQLISNAAKFTQHGEIRIAAARDGALLVFTVSDTGIGIPVGDQARIFEPFTQADNDPARRYDGAGLGLTLVRRLARLMGGDVSCDSAPGRGAVFRLWIDAGR